jgi:hypothetical protein
MATIPPARLLGRCGMVVFNQYKMTPFNTNSSSLEQKLDLSTRGIMKFSSQAFSSHVFY